MTPLQMQKYSDFKKKYVKDVLLDKKRKNYKENLELVNLFKKQNPKVKTETLKINENISYFFYHKRNK